MKPLLDVFFFKKAGLSFVTKDLQINEFGKLLLELDATSQMCEEALREGGINQKGIEYFLPQTETEAIKASEATGEFELKLELIDHQLREAIEKGILASD